MSKANDVQHVANQAAELRANLEQTIIGQPNMVNGMVYGVLAGGPIALTGVPGTAKTLASRALAHSLDARYARVQVMADMLPSDFTGARVFNFATGEWTFEHGPLFADVVHLDELNRVGGRALSGIMEAMEERQVSVGGNTYRLPDGQVIVATFNPSEHAGTEELPDAIADRFTVQVLIERPDPEAEVMIAAGQFVPPHELRPVLTLKDVDVLTHFVGEVAKATELAVVQYAVDIARATADTKLFERAAGVRASRDLVRVAAAKAVTDGRVYALEEDIAHVAPLVLRHRVELAYGVDITVEQAIEELL